VQGRSNYTIQPLSERAVVVQFDPVINEETLSFVLSFKSALLEKSFEGLLETVPGYCSITIYYDPTLVNKSKLEGATAFNKVCQHLNSLNFDFTKTKINTISHTIPVCYDIRCGLDLPDLSKTLKLSVNEIINLHSKPEYTVYLIGFTPGFPYMGILPGQLECKRKANPRKKVPPGSVAIAGKQTGIYPYETPGGWQIIGRTPVTLFSPDRNQPGLFKPGDKVKFEPISFEEFEILV
jgi:inhibitor of KinA